VAQEVARSLLVKTAVHGRDPNWGRILAAAGMAGVAFDPHKVEIKFGKVTVAKKGLGLGAEAEAQAKRVMSEPSYTITLKLGPGKAKAHYLFCDVGAAYVDVNAGYRS
jgi:glutamate N-acetyltransferase/amino-acid N-acetyltransferase